MKAADLLPICLEAAVPLHADELRRLPWAEVERLARGAAETVAAHGDDLQFGGRDCAVAFNALARGLAALSFLPGGVRFLSCRFVFEHPEAP